MLRHREASGSGSAVWCGADAVSEGDFSALRGAYLTRFAYELGVRNPLVLESALETIDQHHPGEVVWIEAAPPQADSTRPRADVRRWMSYPTTTEHPSALQDLTFKKWKRNGNETRPDPHASFSAYCASFGLCRAHT